MERRGSRQTLYVMRAFASDGWVNAVRRSAPAPMLEGRGRGEEREERDRGAGPGELVTTVVVAVSWCRRAVCRRSGEGQQATRLSATKNPRCSSYARLLPPQQHHSGIHLPRSRHSTPHETSDPQASAQTAPILSYTLLDFFFSKSYEQLLRVCHLRLTAGTQPNLRLDTLARPNFARNVHGHDVDARGAPSLVDLCDVSPPHDAAPLPPDRLPPLRLQVAKRIQLDDGGEGVWLECGVQEDDGIL